MPKKSPEQIDILADFIMAKVPGELSENEGAGDCAIRIIKKLERMVDKACRCTYRPVPVIGIAATNWEPPTRKWLEEK